MDLLAFKDSMMQFLRPSFAWSLILIVLFTVEMAAEEQPASTSTPVTSTSETTAAAEKAAHLDRMRKLAQSITVFTVAGEERVAVKLLERPVLAYRDDTRKTSDSTMWIFGVEGRPRAMLAVEHYGDKSKGGEWLFEIASLSTGQIAAERNSDLKWQARQAGLELRTLTDARSPAAKPTARLSQMRELRRRFAAHEREGTDGRVELQPLSAPLYRYQDPQQGIIDGAIFAFANGTNPEVLWVIEAHQAPDGASIWKFGLAQMTGAALFVQLDDKEIWKRDDSNPPAVRDSYVNGWLPEAVVPGAKPQ